MTRRAFRSGVGRLAAATDPGPVKEIQRVAEDVNPLAVDYGQTAWLADDAAVLWVSGDGTSNEQIDEAAAKFLAIDGVDGFVHEAEAMPDGWCDAEVVYGGDPFAGRCAENAQAAVDAAETAATADSPTEAAEPLNAALNASELDVDAEVAALVELARSPLPPDPE